MLYRVVLLTVVISFLLGCTASIAPPEVLSEPRTVQLLRHARHSTLLLTAPDRSRIRYAYGDWSWYVEEDESLSSGARALLRTSQAALGRQHLGAEQTGERLESLIGVGIDQAFIFEVEASLIDALLDSLEQVFHDSASPPYFSAARQLEFVPHPQPYTFRHNSNHLVADWLRELGVEVDGNPAMGRWRMPR